MNAQMLVNILMNKNESYRTKLTELSRSILLDKLSEVVKLLTGDIYKKDTLVDIQEKINSLFILSSALLPAMIKES